MNWERPRLGVSACLLGRKVRFDGGHKLDRFVAETLGAYVDFVPVCPEVELGLGVPRDTLRLEGEAAAPRLVVTRTREDITERMAAWARRRVEELAQEDLCGYIFKSKSPSSGMQGVKLYGGKGAPSKKGVGVFARVFMERFPLLPVEDEGRLNDPGLRENFIERVFALKRWRDAAAQGMTRGRLVEFHTDHKMLIFSHGEAKYRAMGRLVAGAAGRRMAEVAAEYEAALMEALKARATVKSHVNTLAHAMGYLKKMLSADEKQELLEVIEEYRKGWAPLLVPVTLINHYARKFGEAYLLRQTYLRPHPAELKLRAYVA
ncbi:MAG TPA: DUF523 and DUF1722 domain-containing protein [Candidatus Brocadiia bacterium]|nr:DUF523 and DUF1722 domain-containing protein [Candidatus Brocadiia bacterium]